MVRPYLLLCLEIAKVLEELRFGRELGGLEEVQEAEEFFHRVLEGGAGQQHLVFLEGEEKMKGANAQMISQMDISRGYGKPFHKADCLSH